MGASDPLVTHLRANPDDADAWLVYADQLLDQGDIRGELLGIEHQLHTLPPSERSARAALYQRRKLLETEHRAQWLSGLKLPASIQLEWRAGFITAISLHKALEKLDFLAHLAEHPTGRFLQSLSGCEIHLGDKHMVALSRLPPSVQLNTIHLKGNTIGAAGIRSLVRAPLCQHIENLELDNNDIGDVGVYLLSSATSLPKLETLSLESNILTDASAEALAASTSLRALRTLNLSENQITGIGVTRIASSPALATLAWLHLSGNKIGLDGVHALLHSQTLSLYELSLRSALSPEALLALARGPWQRPPAHVDARYNLSFGQEALLQEAKRLSCLADRLHLV